MNEIYTSGCGMFRVIERNGRYFPQERRVTVSGVGRLSSEQEVQAFLANQIDIVQESDWHGFYGSCKQFGSYRGDKSFKTAKGAIAFADRCSEQVREYKWWHGYNSLS